MNIQTLRQLVRHKRYHIKLHAVQHALQEGFNEQAMIDAIVSGRIIERYPERARVLISGQVTLETGDITYLHIVCQQNYIDQFDIVTAYVPSISEWETPPIRRKRNIR